MRVFLDSSAWLKNYIAETGTARVKARLREADELILSVIAWPEAISALNRLRREAALDAEGYAMAKEAIEEDLPNATVIPLTADVLARAVRCLENAPLRAGDAIHVATALEAMPDRFISSDHRQCEAARAMGLGVEEVTSDD